KRQENRSAPHPGGHQRLNDDRHEAVNGGRARDGTIRPGASPCPRGVAADRSEPPAPDAHRPSGALTGPDRPPRPRTPAAPPDRPPPSRAPEAAPEARPGRPRRSARPRAARPRAAGPDRRGPAAPQPPGPSGPAPRASPPRPGPAPPTATSAPASAGS